MTSSTPPPTILAERYELVQRLARGGMADVYLARDTVLHREVAVKVMFAHYANDPAFVSRFQREAKSAAGLNHPNVVAVYDSGAHSDTYFIVMEYIDGQTLADKLAAEGALGVDQANEIAADVADALSVAHRQGMVHRDIKPSNILLTRGGHAKVTDFGIARAVEGDADLTATGSVMGTAAYFSPEQAQGLPVDPRSDLYSLGVVMFEMVTGSTPFTGPSDVSVAYKHVQELAPAARSLQPSVDPGMDTIIATLLAKQPADRYPTAADLRADLDRLWNKEPLQGTPAPRPASAAPGDAGRTVAMSVPQQNRSPAPVAGATSVQGRSPTEAPATRQRTQAYGSEPSSGSTGSGWFVGILALLLLVLIAGIILIANGFIGGGDDGTPSELVIVPTVVGDTQATATNVLIDAELVPLVRFEQNDEVEAGLVFAQDPAPRTEVEKGETVTITVAAADDTVQVPDVVNQTLEEARAALRSLGFVINVEGQPSDDVEAGRVISQSIEALQEANIGAEVTLTVSTGPEAKQVPSVVGQTQEAAEEQLRELGLVPQIELVDVGEDDASIGRVISQSPQAGQEAPAGTIVNIRVGRVGDTTTTSSTTTTTSTTTTSTTQPTTTSTSTSTSTTTTTSTTTSSTSSSSTTTTGP